MAAEDDDCHERMDLARRLLGGSIVHGWVNSNTEYSRYQNAWGDEDDTEGETGTGITTPVTEAFFGTPEQRAVTGYEGPDIPAHTFRHPLGGVAGFLTDAIMEGAPATEAFVGGLSSIFEEPNGSTTALNVFKDVAMELIDIIAVDAPVEIADLRTVVDAKVWSE